MLGGLPLSSASPLPLCCLVRKAVKLSAAPQLDPPGTKATGHCRAQGHFGIQHCGQKAPSPVAPPEGFKTSPKSPPNLPKTSVLPWGQGSPSTMCPGWIKRSARSHPAA